MKKKTLLALVTVLMVLPAAAFNLSLQPEENTAGPESPADYQVNLSNTDTDNHSYSISLISPRSSWFYTSSTVNVDAETSNTFNLTASPVKNALQERYRFKLKAREVETGNVKTVTGFLQVSQPYRLQIKDVKLEENSFNPGEVLETSVRVRNLDNTPLNDYSVETAYRNQTRSKSGTAILPGGERIYDYSFRVSPDSRPGNHTLKYRTRVNGEIDVSTEKNIRIEEVVNISRNSSTENRILTLSKNQTVRNTGNSPSKATLTLQIPSYLTPITTTTPEPDTTKEVEGNTIYTWKNNLKPGESYTASYTTRYWIPLTATLLLAAVITAVKKLGQEIQIQKTTEYEKGEVKVKIEITNTTDKTFRQLQLEDFIPDIANVSKTFHMNTPEVRKTSKGTVLDWKIEKLEPGDQRIIQYRIEPKLEVEGKAKLQSATLKDQNGQKIAESKTASTRFKPDTT